MSKITKPNANALAPVEALNVQPKPRKSDILAALVARARQKHQAEYDAHMKVIEKAGKEAEEAVEALLKSSPQNFKKHVKISRWNDAPEIEFTLQIETPAVSAALKKYKEVCRQDLGGFDEAATKNRIAKTLDDSPARVTAILSSPQMVKALDKILTSVGN